MPPNPLIEAAVARESNNALATGALVSTGLGVVGAISPLFTPLSAPIIYAPMGFALTAAVLSFAVHLLARRGHVLGPTAWASMIAFALLPTLFFIACSFLLPTGAATFIHGPVVWTYFVAIAVSGTLFRPGLTTTVGVVTSAGYLLSFMLAAPHLASIGGPPGLLPDIQMPALAAIRACMLVTSALVVAGLAMLARRLTATALNEQRDKETVSRLLGEYVSEEVKAKLLESPLAEAGQHRDVAIMFSDVRNFTQLSEQTDPQAMVRRLNEYFDAMVAAISAEGGVVDKFVGDAIMAVFGGVVELSDPCGAAVRAAQAMRTRLQDLRERWAAEAIPPFDIGIGVHSGTVLQGAIGAHHRKDFTVIGDPVNTASRIEGLTKDLGYPILVSEPVHRQLAPELASRCVPLGAHPVKGRSATVNLFGLKDS